MNNSMDLTNTSQNLENRVKDLMKTVDSTALLNKPLPDWRNILYDECQVYVYGENYIAKRFDQINFKFCEQKEAKEILIDNLYSILRNKYFPRCTEEIDDRINEIVKSFTENLKTTLKRVSFDENTDAIHIKTLPDYCVAFRNGVFNFKDNKWLFKYDIIDIEKLHNKIYLYTPEYAILWYFNYDFEPIGIDIMNTDIRDMVDFMKDLTTENRNLCFELLYNISHNSRDEFDINRFIHLCEILGYTLLQSFSQYFIMLIGSGQNGKNSLFDGCLTNRVIPSPASEDLDSIETNDFITGILENKAHNIFLETSAKTYTESKMLKNLTGSMYQSINKKGIQPYSSVINCKYIFAGNDQDKIKFSDTTKGFRRRNNTFEIFYSWDEDKKFMKRGDYYDTTFSDSLWEIKSDPLNTTMYIYFGMYGILEGTKKFTKNFQFTLNDWNDKYFDIDFDLKEEIERITPQTIYNWIKRTNKNYNDGKFMLFDTNKERLYNSKTLHQIGFSGYDEMLDMLNSLEDSAAYFSENDIYISVRLLQSLCRDESSSTIFTQKLKKIYKLTTLESLYNNKPYIKCTFMNRRLKILQ